MADDDVLFAETDAQRPIRRLVVGDVDTTPVPNTEGSECVGDNRKKLLHVASWHGSERRKVGHASRGIEAH